MKMPGAEAFVKCLEEEGVEVIFGYPGGVVLTIFDYLFDAKIRTLLVRHEQAAAHAADGYARATGKVGVCLSTSGPGATNLVTGIANAYMDSVPIVAFTGQVAREYIGRDSFQEADITGITNPITKHNYLVKDAHELPRIIKEAFHIARTGRPGPVLIDLPKDISTTVIDFKYPKEVNLRGYKPTVNGHPKQISAAAKMINNSSRPLIYAGGGIISSEASRELTDLAEKLGAPVVTTLLGKGAIPETHELCLGMLGMHGSYYANMAVCHTDLLIAVGCRFDDRVTGKLDEFAPNAGVIHIDVDPAEIGKNVAVDVPIVGDAKNVLGDLIKQVDPKDCAEWCGQAMKWKKAEPLRYGADGLAPQFVIEKLWDLTRGQAIITTEVGQNQMWTAQFYKIIHPRTFISSGGLGTMGFGFPAAIGAQIGRPDMTVIDIAGDGSIQMNIQELNTAVSNRLPVKIVILNNSFLGMIRQWQEMFYNRRYSNSDISDNPDFVKVAEAFGARARAVHKKSEVVPALKWMLQTDSCAVLDVHVNREENVLPMVAPGACIDTMTLVDDSGKKHRKRPAPAAEDPGVESGRAGSKGGHGK